MKPLQSIASYFIPILLCAFTLPAQSFVLHGIVTAEDTKEPLPIVTVLTGDRKVGVLTNDFGQYALRLARVPDSIYFRVPGGGNGYLDTLITGLRDNWQPKFAMMTLDMPLRVEPDFGPIIYITDHPRKKDGRKKLNK